MITIEKPNASRIKILSDKSIALEIRDKYTFYAQSYKHHPKFKAKLWDGKIRMFNSQSRTMAAGLLTNLCDFFKEQNYEFEVKDSFKPQKVSFDEIESFIATLGLPKHLVPRDYQLNAIYEAINDTRGIYISPTASGKSFIIYIVWRWFRDHNQTKKSILVVPTVGLVKQMYSDFESYGFNSQDNIHMITSGADKETDKELIISTWQSIYKLDKQWFLKFNLIIGDEVHRFTAVSLNTIMNNLENAHYRFGFSGTLDGSTVNELTLEGLFGPIKYVTTTHKLMQEGHVAKFKIKTIVIKYSDEYKKWFASNKFEYRDEINLIVGNQTRNKIIVNLIKSIKEGNTIVFFKYIENHGVHLKKMIEESLEGTGRKFFYIDGSISADERDEIRHAVEQEKNAVILASTGTTSTGINIISLRNMIFTTPTKSQITVLQSIGRTLRQFNNKEAVLYDIADDLTFKKKINHTYRHFLERLQIYIKEKFDYTVYYKEMK